MHMDRLQFFLILIVNDMMKNMTKLHTIDTLSWKDLILTSGTSKWFWFKSEFIDFVMRIPASETFPNYCFHKMNRLYRTFTDRIIILSQNWFIYNCSSY